MTHENMFLLTMKLMLAYYLKNTRMEVYKENFNYLLPNYPLSIFICISFQAFAMYVHSLMDNT